MFLKTGCFQPESGPDAAVRVKLDMSGYSGQVHCGTRAPWFETKYSQKASADVFFGHKLSQHVCAVHLSVFILVQRGSNFVVNGRKVFELPYFYFHFVPRFFCVICTLVSP